MKITTYFILIFVLILSHLNCAANNIPTAILNECAHINFNALQTYSNIGWPFAANLYTTKIKTITELCQCYQAIETPPLWLSDFTELFTEDNSQFMQKEAAWHIIQWKLQKIKAWNHLLNENQIFKHYSDTFNNILQAINASHYNTSYELINEKFKTYKQLLYTENNLCIENIKDETISFPKDKIDLDIIKNHIQKWSTRYKIVFDHLESIYKQNIQAVQEGGNIKDIFSTFNFQNEEEIFY